MSDLPTSQSITLLEPGTLWQQTSLVTARAVRSGAQQPIATNWHRLEHGGVWFLVRTLPHLGKKLRARSEQERKGPAFNPFLPHDPDLFVADISSTHLCLLNKFNTIDHHLLIVTRAFEPQESLLTESDFVAMWICMAEFPALAFYNGGTVAGASQGHKHLQMVPLPLVDAGPPVPMEPLLVAPLATAARSVDGIARAPEVPFTHLLAAIDPAWLPAQATLSAPAATATIGTTADATATAVATSSSVANTTTNTTTSGPSQAAAGIAQVARATHERYLAMLARLDLLDSASTPRCPYNLLVTRQWMLLVPRTRECCGTISINALGFAGSLFVRNGRELRTLEEIGPLNMLRQVAGIDSGRDT